MGKVIRDAAASDSSDKERRKTVREERKVKRRKKRKRDLTDLHQRVLKAKKVLRKHGLPHEFWQSSYIKLLNRFADKREEYDKKTKGSDDKSGKARGTRKICNRLLPRPLAGIYRNGVTGKEICRPRKKLTVNESNKARLQGDVLKLLHGYESKSENIVPEQPLNDVHRNSLPGFPTKNNLQPTPGDDQASPILGKMDGKKRCTKKNDIENFVSLNHIDNQQKPLTKKGNHFQSIPSVAIKRYEELCSTISNEHFEQLDFPGDGIDPLSAVKKKLRGIYAQTFHSHYLRKMIRQGEISNDNENFGTIASVPMSPEKDCRFSNDDQNVDSSITNTVSVADDQMYQYRYKKHVEESNTHGDISPTSVSEANLMLEKAKKATSAIPAPNFLFEPALLSNTVSKKPRKSSKLTAIKEMSGTSSVDDDLAEMNEHNYFSLHTNRDTGIGMYKTDNNSNNRSAELFRYLTDDKKDGKKSAPLESPCFTALEVEELPRVIINKDLHMKRKNRGAKDAPILNNRLKKRCEKFNLKAPQQNLRSRNPKHVPAILRRYNNNNTCVNKTDRVNIFDKSTCVDKEPGHALFTTQTERNVLFSRQTVMSELIDDSESPEIPRAGSAANMQILSPSLNNNQYFIENPRVQSNHASTQTQIRLEVPDEVFRKANNTGISVHPPHQRTVLFTKKDLQIARCVRSNDCPANNVINDDACQPRKRISSQREAHGNHTCAAHQYCQQNSANCYRSMQCSQNSDTSHYDSQEFELGNYCHQSYEELPHHELHRAQKQPACDKLTCKQKMTCSKACHENDQCVRLMVVDQCKDLSDTVSPHFENLRLLPVDERDPQTTFKLSEDRCNAVMIEDQPVKYLAFENNSKTQRIPIYAHTSNHVPPVENVELIGAKANCRASCPKETVQKIVLVPRYEQKKVVCVKPQHLSHSSAGCEDCSHQRQFLFCKAECQSNVHVKDSTNVCSVHVSKKNVAGTGNPECGRYAFELQKMENMNKSTLGVCWKKDQYRSNHEHSLLDDSCVKTQTVCFRK